MIDYVSHPGGLLSSRSIASLQTGNDWLGERVGGLNRVFTELLRSLPGAGVTVRGLVAGSPDVETLSGGVVRAFAPRNAPMVTRLIRARQAALSILREDAPDLIACHFALYGFPLLDRLRKMPTVIHFHGPWAAEAGVEGNSGLISSLQSKMERAVYSAGRRAIVLSRAFAMELERRYQFPGDKIRIVPGGVDIERFTTKLSRSDARQQIGWPTDRPIVLAVRRHVRRMGLENLIDASRTIKEAIPDLLVMIAGTGPITGELRDRIASHGLDGAVKLIGRLEEDMLPVAYRAADVTIVPTQALEGFGMITLEALASGTPVIVTPVGGLPEVIKPFAPQCVLETTSEASIAEALKEFLKGSRRLPSSEECRFYATQNYSWQVIARKTRAVYEEAIG